MFLIWKCKHVKSAIKTSWRQIHCLTQFMAICCLRWDRYILTVHRLCRPNILLSLDIDCLNFAFDVKELKTFLSVQNIRIPAGAKLAETMRRLNGLSGRLNFLNTVHNFSYQIPAIKCQTCYSNVYLQVFNWRNSNLHSSWKPEHVIQVGVFLCTKEEISEKTSHPRFQNGCLSLVKCISMENMKWLMFWNQGICVLLLFWWHATCYVV